MEPHSRLKCEHRCNKDCVNYNDGNKLAACGNCYAFDFLAHPYCEWCYAETNIEKALRVKTEAMNDRALLYAIESYLYNMDAPPRHMLMEFIRRYKFKVMKGVI